MSEKSKCTVCNEREASLKKMCTRCYAKAWYHQRKAARAAEIAPKQLTSGVTKDEIDTIEGEIVHDQPAVPETHLTALSPAEMQAAQGGLKAWLEQRLTIIERDIVEANAALNEARQNGWATSALTSLRNRAVDDETYYYKILMAVEAGHTIIPDFPISVFAVRRGEPVERRHQEFFGVVRPSETWIGHPAESDCAPAGAGEYRNPQPETSFYTTENREPNAQERGEHRYNTTALRTGRPIGPISFPSMTARSPIMRATAKAMEDKVFDQIGVCHPVVAAQAARRVDTAAIRAGDPLVIGQILHKKVGSKQKCASFIIAWHLNLKDL